MENSSLWFYPEGDDTVQDNTDLELVRTILTSIYIIFAILGIVGNGLVLVVIARIKDLQDVTNLLIANQSLIDFMTSLFLLFGFVVPVPTLPANQPTLARFICAFWYTKYPFWSTIVASCLNLAMITLERYVAVVFPIHYRVHTISGKAFLMTLIPWISGFVFQIYLLLFNEVKNGQCLDFLWPDKATKIGVCAATYLLEFLIPVGTMAFVYSRILIELRRSADKFLQPSNEPSTQKFGEQRVAIDFRGKARKNTIKTLATVSICFIICMSLNQHIYIAYGFGMNLDFGGSLYITSVVMAFGNIWINPLVYTFQYERFKRGIKKLFCGYHTQSMPSKSITN